MAHVIGIDLDTATSRAAVWNPHLQDVTHIPNLRGEYSTPFFIGFDRDGQVNIGAEARAKLPDAPQDTLCALNGSLEHFKSTRINGNDFDWQTAAAMMLTYLKQGAETYLQEPVFDAVLTCPAYYTMTQRNALYDAGMIAGLNIRYLLNPSTAAAISHQFFSLNSGETKTLLVVNLGNSGFDLSVVELGENVTVFGSGGIADAGTHAIAQSITEWAFKKIGHFYVVNLRRDEKVKNELLLEASAVIQNWDDQEKVKFRLEDRVLNDGRLLSVNLSLTQWDLTVILTQLSEKWSGCLDETLADTADSQCVGWADLDGVLLVGEFSSLPVLRATILESFKKHCPGKNIEILTNSSPKESAVKGVAILAGTKVPYGISPFESDEKKTMAQGHNLSMVMDEPEFELYDITQHSLGIGLVESRFYPVLKKGTGIPAVVEVPGFSNATADTTQMVAEIFEGEEELIQDNKRIGEVVIFIEPLPAGQHNHSIEFEIDVSGRFSISCSDMRNDKPANYIYEDARLSLAEIRLRHERVGKLISRQAVEIQRTVTPITDPPSPPLQAVSREIDFESLNLPTEEIPLEWRNYWIKCHSLLPKLDPTQRVLLGQAMNSFMTAIKKGDPKQIEACGQSLQDALLEVWM